MRKINPGVATLAHIKDNCVRHVLTLEIELEKRMLPELVQVIEMTVINLTALLRETGV